MLTVENEYMLYRYIHTDYIYENKLNIYIYIFIIDKRILLIDRKSIKSILKLY